MAAKRLGPVPGIGPHPGCLGFCLPRLIPTGPDRSHNSVLPEFVINGLAAVRKITGKHVLWASSGNLDVIVGSWQKRLRKLLNWLECPVVTPQIQGRFRS